MDAYFSVAKLSAAAKNRKKDTKRDDRTYKPYTVNRTGQADKPEQPSAAAVTKFLLSTLADESNPITHSDSAAHAVHVSSTATGHQVSEGRSNRRLYLEDRGKKLNVQTKEATATNEPQVLVNVRCYINGFLADTTDLEMKRMITSVGGEVLPTPSNATHILTSQHLSGSKTHRILTAKSRSRVPHVVKPEWVMDSIKAGKRRPEREYSVITNHTTNNLFDMLQKK
ncbi:hypothetical protein B0H10DRAFT_1989283 [Mycena sp. CBHHK59/15]|nr:hypothetical protein B0H10DRAFT_1989283 [Mycena sp. CBHHK59/15]